jgi:hypothetical protein
MPAHDSNIYVNRQQIIPAGIYKPYCTSSLQAQRIEVFFTRRYVDHHLEETSPSLGQAALQQSIIMAPLNGKDYRNFVDQHEIFERKPTPAEIGMEKDLLALQVGFYDAVAIQGQENTPEGHNLENFATHYPSLYLWSVIKNNLLQPSGAFRYDTGCNVITNLHRAEIALYVKNSFAKFRETVDFIIPELNY